MRKFIIGLLAATLIAPSAVNAATVLLLDLTVLNRITITATGEASDATATGSAIIGFYLDGALSGADVTLGDVLIEGGDLTSAENTPNGTPNLFMGFGGDTGLNVFDYTDDGSSDFVAGNQAFSGFATWAVTPDAYAAALAGATSGLVYFPADDISDLSGATVIGEWRRIPVPAAVWLMLSALGGLGFLRRR